MKNSIVLSLLLIVILSFIIVLLLLNRNKVAEQPVVRLPERVEVLATNSREPEF